MTDLPPIVTFWHGPLSWLERLCLASFVTAGHPVAVYAYERPEGLPQGVEWRDAEAIVPQSSMVFYKGRGTPAVFADLFRLRLLKAGKGIWADADIYCLRPFADPPDYFMGYERPPRPDGTGGSINVAVLGLPADAPLLDDLLSVFEGGERPLFEPHLPLGRRLEVAARRLLGSKVPPEHMQYGATGPFALTHYVRAHGLGTYVQPPEIFYPVPYEGIPALMRAGSDIEAAITPKTLALHIWRSQLTDRGRADLPAPEVGSALDKLLQRDGVDV